MPTRFPRHHRLPRLLSTVLVALWVAFSAAPSAQAKTKTKGLRHIFVISRVEVPEGAPAQLAAQVKSQLLKNIEAQPQLLSAIPADAPAVDENQKGLAGNKAFRKYMQKHGMRAYNVIIQVTAYEATLTPNSKKPGNIVGSQIALRMFGDTIPERVMAFSGDGSAKVLIEVGKKVRAKDREFADSEALQTAIADALKTSLDKLEEVPPKEKKRKKKS